MNKYFIDMYVPFEKIKELSSFFKKAYREDIFISSLEALLWQFKQDKGLSVINAYTNEQIVATYGYIQKKALWGSITSFVNAVSTVNWYVDKNNRGSLGYSLVRTAKKKFDLIITIGVSSEAKKLLELDYWLISSETKRIVYTQLDNNSLILNDINIEKFKYSKDFNPDWNLYNGLKFAIVRDVDFLEWRYLNHPIFKYNILMYGKQKREALLVYREEKSFGYFSKKVYKIIEFFHPSDKEGREDGITLLSFLSSLAIKNGIYYIDFVCTNKEYLETMELFGFYEDTECQYPSRITPVQYQKENYDVAIWSKNNIYPDIEDIYISRGDADGDRPVFLNNKGILDGNE